jgi:hypothetical protein
MIHKCGLPVAIASGATALDCRSQGPTSTGTSRGTTTELSRGQPQGLPLQSIGNTVGAQTSATTVVHPRRGHACCDRANPTARHHRGRKTASGHTVPGMGTGPPCFLNDPGQDRGRSRQSAPLAFYLPMQKRLKIWSRMSSAPTSPVTARKASAAVCSSTLTMSSGMPSCSAARD